MKKTINQLLELIGRLWKILIQKIGVLKARIRKLIALVAEKLLILLNHVVRAVEVPFWMGLSAFLGAGFVIALFDIDQLFPGGFNNNILDKYLTDKEVLDKVKQALLIGVTAFGGGVLLTTVKTLSTSVPSLWSYVFDEKRNLKNLVQAGIAVFIAFFGLTLAIFPYVNGDIDILGGGEKANKVEKNYAYYFTTARPIVTEKEKKPLATFSFSFDKEAGEESLTRKNDEAVTLDFGKVKHHFSPMMEALLECGSEDEKVVIEIAGYASSSKFNESYSECALGELGPNGRATDKGEAFNLCVAERRANNLKVDLENILTEEQKKKIHIEAYKWKNYAEMGRYILFDDLDDNGLLNLDKAYLARRIDFRILSTPACSIDDSKAGQNNQMAVAGS